MSTTAAAPPPSSSASNRLNSSTLIIGPTKSGKTTLVATLSEWLWEEYRKVLFFNTCELGGFSARVEQRIRQGLIRPFRMRTRDDVNSSLSFETLHLASKGYVPARFVDAQAGEVEPGVAMVAPMTTFFTQVCPHCGDVFKTRFKTKVISTRGCASCKKSVLLAQTPPSLLTVQTPGFEQIGTFGFDGLTSMSDWYLQDMSHRKNLEGEKAALGGDVQSGDLVFRGNNRSQVGMAQTRVHELVANSLGIPNLQVMPVWTAISHESSDDTGRLQIVGPKLAGDAKTYIAASWFGNVTEADVVTNEKNEYIRRLYVSQFYDEYGRRHLCGHRGDPRFMPIYIEDAPYSDQHPPREICTGFSLKKFQQILEQSIQQGIDTDSGITDTPGVAAIPTSYGGAEKGEIAQAASTPAAGARPGIARRPTPRGGTKPAPPASAPVTHDTSPAPEQPVVAETGAEIPQPEETEETEGPEAESVAAPAVQALADTPPDAVSSAPEASTSAAVATTAPAASGGAWTRPAGSRPPAPRAPQAGPKVPARATPRPVTAVKPN